ncbi:MAG: prepilin-type N-terminal cleavage/methylation domain-containing protein [Gammaproteobacteria bacterium]|nr:prepilin-type N-terminal cleavage/methylation domain-containing protein [Gammaproteobacteria bacterium]
MKTNNQSGFTLIEVMMVIVLGSIIITLAIPGFRSFIQNNRIVTQTNGLVTSLILARSEAIKRGTRVSVCASSDSSSWQRLDQLGQWLDCLH